MGEVSKPFWSGLPTLPVSVASRHPRLILPLWKFFLLLTGRSKGPDSPGIVRCLRNQILRPLALALFGCRSSSRPGNPRVLKRPEPARSTFSQAHGRPVCLHSLVNTTCIAQHLLEVHRTPHRHPHPRLTEVHAAAHAKRPTHRRWICSWLTKGSGNRLEGARLLGRQPRVGETTARAYVAPSHGATTRHPWVARSAVAPRLRSHPRRGHLVVRPRLRLRDRRDPWALGSSKLCL